MEGFNGPLLSGSDIEVNQPSPEGVPFHYCKSNTKNRRDNATLYVAIKAAQRYLKWRAHALPFSSAENCGCRIGDGIKSAFPTIDLAPYYLHLAAPEKYSFSGAARWRCHENGGLYADLSGYGLHVIVDCRVQCVDRKEGAVPVIPGQSANGIPDHG